MGYSQLPQYKIKVFFFFLMGYSWLSQLLLLFSCPVMSDSLQHPRTAARQASLSLTISQSLPKFMSIAWVMPSSHLILWCPLLLLPSIFGVSASATVLPMSVQGWFPLRLTGWIWCSPRDSQESPPAPHFEGTSSLVLSLLYSPALTTIHTPQKTTALTIQTFANIVMSLLFNTLFRFVIAFLPRSKYLLISWLQSPSAVIFEPKKRKICHYFHLSLLYLPWNSGDNAMILFFVTFSFKPSLSLSPFTLIKRLFISSSLSAIRVLSSAYLRLLMSLPAEVVDHSL